MDDIVIWQGARLDLQVTTDDEDAVSCSIVLTDSLGTQTTVTVPYVDLVADFQDNETIPALPAGDYTYYVQDNYEDGLPAIFPDPDDCDGECELPTLKICATEEEES